MNYAGLPWENTRTNSVSTLGNREIRSQKGDERRTQEPVDGVGSPKKVRKYP